VAFPPLQTRGSDVPTKQK